MKKRKKEMGNDDLEQERQPTLKDREIPEL